MHPPSKLLAKLALPSALACLYTLSACGLGELPNSRGQIRLRVLDGQGLPIEGAQVAIQRRTRKSYLPRQGDLALGYRWSLHSSRSDEQGEVLLEDLGPGDWRCRAGSPLTWLFHTSEWARLGDTVDLTLTPVPQDRLLAGRVRLPDGETSHGIPVRFLWDDDGKLASIRALTDSQGQFSLLAKQAGQLGALLAFHRRLEFNSDAIDPIRAGRRDLELQLGEAERLRFEVRDTFGREVSKVHAGFYWQLAGHQVHSPANSARASSEAPWWERSEIPFFAKFSAEGFKAVEVGPILAEQVEGDFELSLTAYPRLEGRVLFEGMGVDRPKVNWRRLPDTSERGMQTSPTWGSVRGEKNGSFSFVAKTKGRYELKAWKSGLGGGRVNSVPFDPSAAQEAVVVELTEPPGEVHGQVILPEGRRPRELWLSTNKTGGYMPLAEDGSYRLPDLPAGPLVINLRRGRAIGSDIPPAPTTASLESAPAWVRMSHGPKRAPDWLEIESTFEVDVLAGQVVNFDIDLVNPQPFRVEGRLLLDGQVLTPEPAKEDMWSDAGYAIALGDGHWWGYRSRTDFDAEGRFQLQSPSGGSQNLSVRIPFERPLFGVIWDSIELQPGVVYWKKDLATGSLIIEPKPSRPDDPPFYGDILWFGPDGLRGKFTLLFGGPNSGPLHFPQMPAGKIQLVLDSPHFADVLLEAELKAGETMVLENPLEMPGR